MTVVEYETSWGERMRLAICADRYEQGDALALLAINITDPGDEEWYLGLWDVLTVNLPGDPDAVAWCSERGNVVVDVNNVPAALVDALIGAGVIELTDRSVRSGFCSYPLATVPPRVLVDLRGYEETVRVITGAGLRGPELGDSIQAAADVAACMLPDPNLGEPLSR